MREITRNILPFAWNVHVTGKEMYRLARQYSSDVLPYIHMSPEEFFYMVAKIPYRSDPDGEEYLSRPLAIFQNIGRGLDCDQKAIALGAYFEYMGIPWKFIAVSRHANKPLHHVLAIAHIGGKWQPMDATYPHCTPFTYMGQYEKKLVLRE